MKILILNELPRLWGGLEIQGELLYRGLRKQGVECKLGYYSHQDYSRKEREWLYRTFRPDVVIGVGWWVDTPHIIEEPQSFGSQPVPWLLSDGWVANYHEIISALPLAFVTSRWVKETYQRDAVNTRNFEVLPVGYEAHLFHPLPQLDPRVQEMRRMFGVGNREKMLLTVGGDATSKGAQEMIRAFAQIDKEYSNWKYVCKSTYSECARNNHKEEVALMEEMGLPREKIVYAEDDFSRESMPYLLNACDVYVAPSRIEGFGMVQVEAMACGKPVISIDAMGPKDTIVHGKTGFLAKVGSTIDLTEEWVTKEMGFDHPFRMKFDKPKTLAYRADVDDLANYTLQLLTDGRLREEMGRQAAQHARANFQYQDIAKRCVDMIREKLHIE
mgnify:CR=1 FL=1